ncbi:MAG: ABC transporter permease [Victivallales bacterium]|nr:ABC transporter permease [Victivallales bacterium]
MRFSSSMDILKRLCHDRVAAAALVIVLLYMFVAIGCEAYSCYCSANNETPFYELADMNKSYNAPSSEHLLGTDFMGRDVFYRALAGTATAVKVGTIASVISALIGVSLGVMAGYFGGRTDNFVVWIYSTFASMPTLLFILAFALLASRGFLYPPLAKTIMEFGRKTGTDPGMIAVYTGIGFTGWVALCRVVRAEAMRLREASYVQAARTAGFNSFHIIVRHVIPNLFHLVIIYFTMRFAYAIMTEVIVSYLGFGVQSAPSWGVMIANGQQRLWRGVWWEVAGATGFMFFLVLTLNLLGDALRDVLDPKLKN